MPRKTMKGGAPNPVLDRLVQALQAYQMLPNSFRDDNLLNQAGSIIINGGSNALMSVLITNMLQDIRAYDEYMRRPVRRPIKRAKNV